MFEPNEIEARFLSKLGPVLERITWKDHGEIMLLHLKRENPERILYEIQRDDADQILSRISLRSVRGRLEQDDHCG